MNYIQKSMLRNLPLYFRAAYNPFASKVTPKKPSTLVKPLTPRNMSDEMAPPPPVRMKKPLPKPGILFH